MTQAPAGIRGWLQQADQALEAARKALSEPTPGAVEAAGEVFGEAMAALGALQAASVGLPAPDREGLRESLENMRGKARWLAALLDHAAELRLGWARWLAAAVAGYTQQGRPAPLMPTPTVSVEG